jgi:hypothetical protein
MPQQYGLCHVTYKIVARKRWHGTGEKAAGKYNTFAKRLATGSRYQMKWLPCNFTSSIQALYYYSREMKVNHCLIWIESNAHDSAWPSDLEVHKPYIRRYYTELWNLLHSHATFYFVYIWIILTYVRSIFLATGVNTDELKPPRLSVEISVVDAVSLEADHDIPHRHTNLLSKRMFAAKQ